VALRARRTVPGEDIALDVRALLEMAEMFRFRWDPAILVCLAEGPLRFRELAKLVSCRIGDRLEDNALSRSLDRLQRQDLVAAEQTTLGRRIVPVYRITDLGRVHLGRYHALVLAYQQINKEIST